MTSAPVLMYHAVGRPSDKRFRPWVVSPSLLEEHLAALVESGYELVGTTEWAAQKEERKYAVLTFDDGYVDFIENALPILTAHRARATAYVVTAYIGDRAHWLPFHCERLRPLMSWEDLRTIRDSGVEVGSHGNRHLELDVVSPRVAEIDILRSLATLQQNGFSPQSFCYPFGYASRRTRDIVAKAGFTTSCIVGRGLAEPCRDLLRIRRLAIDFRTSPEALLRQINGPTVSPAALLRSAAQPAWRVTRRVRSITCRAMDAEVAK
jgi:peptidoglycan/xylan/chitin deacetylase (PgdA/CDA1 family)